MAAFAVARGVAVALRLDIGAVSGDIGERSTAAAAAAAVLLVEPRALRFAMLSLDGGGVGRGDIRGFDVRAGEADGRGARWTQECRI